MVILFESVKFSHVVNHFNQTIFIFNEDFAIVDPGVIDFSLLIKISSLFCK